MVERLRKYKVLRNFAKKNFVNSSSLITLLLLCLQRKYVSLCSCQITDLSFFVSDGDSNILENTFLFHIQPLWLRSAKNIKVHVHTHALTQKKNSKKFENE